MFLSGSIFPFLRDRTSFQGHIPIDDRSEILGLFGQQILGNIS